MILHNWELNDLMSMISQIWDNFYVISLQVLSKEKQSTKRLYQDSRLPTPDLGKFTDIPAYSDLFRLSTIIQAYSEPCVTLV